MGPEGLRQVADVSYQRAHVLAEQLSTIPGVELAFPDRQFLNEFPVRMFHVEQSLTRLRDAGILGGLPVGRWYPELDGVVVFCCTEVNDPDAIQTLVGVLSESEVAAQVPTTAGRSSDRGQGGQG